MHAPRLQLRKVARVTEEEPVRSWDTLHRACDRCRQSGVTSDPGDHRLLIAQITEPVWYEFQVK